MGWTSPYTYKGYTYKAGDAIVVNGSYYYDITDTTPNGTLNTTKYFHGVWVNDDGSLPLNPVGIRNSSGNTTPTGGTIRFDSIVSGGTGVTYKITINLNGGTATNNFTSMTPTMGTNGWYVFAGNQPTRKGYTFKGLYTAASGGTQIYNASGVCVGDGTYWSGSGETAKWIYPGNVTLYAQWTEHYLTVNYYSNNATSYNGTTASLNTVNNNNVLVYKLNYYYDNAYSSGLLDYSSGSTLGMVRTGYTATGNWGTSTSGGTLVSQSKGFDTGQALAQALGKSLVSGNASINVYAQWSLKTYIVKYNANGGSGSMSDSTATYNTDFTTRKNTFTRTGYTFNGWCETADGTGTWWGLKANGVYESGNSWKWTYDYGITLYAQWVVNKYTLTLNANGGSVATGSVEVTYNSSSNRELSWNIPTRTGHTFKGWYTAASGGTQVYGADGYCTNEGTYWSNSSGSSQWKYAGNVTLYAQWEVNTYTDTVYHWLGGFKNSEGNNGDSKTHYLLATPQFTQNYGANFELNELNAVVIPNGCSLNPTFLCHQKDEWYELGTLITQTAESLTFEYHYIPNDYNITYDLAGGTNHADNPETYNVLYGVSLQEPTREDYTFLGWYIGDQKVTGINEGCNATFSSVDDLYSKLAERMTGDIALTARWEQNLNCAVYADGEYQYGMTYIWSESDGRYVKAEAEVYKYQSGSWVLTKE